MTQQQFDDWQKFNDWYSRFRSTVGTWSREQFDQSLELRLAISQGRYADAEAIIFKIVCGESKEENRLNKLMEEINRE